jgi:oxygen-independent coproporphyrinogen-3 oxidase
MTAPDPGFGVYIHWPFCLAKCPYCDFNSHVRERVDDRRWRNALLAEIDHYAAQAPGRTVTSIFFGGGTPSLMAPETAAALIERVKTRWATASDLEVTLEANPGAAEAARFLALRAAGVNRLSIGVQALDDSALRFLGRIHGHDEAVAAVERARAAFDRYSFDLIYARPGQSVAAWRAELDAALVLAGGHLSVYQLTIEPGTAFHTQARLGALRVPDEDDAAALYEATAERLDAAGLPAYEISNHAAPGQECRHNLTYWRYGDYVGVGPGAHGRLTGAGGKTATRQVRLPESWLAAVEASGHATDAVEPIDATRRRDELLMMGLRLAEGVHRARFAEEVGQPIEAALDGSALARLVDGGFLEVDADGLRATAEGRQRLDAVLAALLA